MHTQMYNPKRKCSVHSNFDFRVNLRSTYRYFWYDAGGYDMMWCLRKLCLGFTQDRMISKTHRGNFAIALNLMDTNFIQIEATVHELLNIASPTEWSTNYLQTVEAELIPHCGRPKIATHNYTMLIMYYLSQNVFDDVTIIFMEEPVFKNGYANLFQQRQQDTQVHVRLNGYVMYLMCLIFKIPI